MYKTKAGGIVLEKFKQKFIIGALLFTTKKKRPVNGAL